MGRGQIVRAGDEPENPNSHNRPFPNEKGRPEERPFHPCDFDQKL